MVHIICFMYHMLDTHNIIGGILIYNNIYIFKWAYRRYIVCVSESKEI